MRDCRVAIVWNNFGPYHWARLEGVRNACDGGVIYGVQVANRIDTYSWRGVLAEEVGDQRFVTLCPNEVAEEVSVMKVFRRFTRFLRKERIDVAFLPSYWPITSAVMLLSAKVCGVKTVMMNESHAGTERATGFKRGLKKLLINLFDAALVGGTPHQRFFHKLGIPQARIFLGYDTVDNEYFAREARCVKGNDHVFRRRYGLPSRFILSLGRFVSKKNLVNLIRAYHVYVSRVNGAAEIPALVFVGSGEEEEMMRATCRALELPTFDQSPGSEASADDFDKSGVVYFYGARQIDETPIFYALSELFVLPSRVEEWGLVVNEAMAAGTAVLVSRVAGCAEDLVADGENGATFDPENPSDLADKLEMLLADRAKLKYMGTRSIEKIARWGCDFFGTQAARALEAVLK